MSASSRLALLEASQFKLAAKARLAESGKDGRFEAADLYHAAARAERRALLALDNPSPEARLASAIEQCACLILGFDSSLVLTEAWPEVLAQSDAVGEAAGAMRVRIDEMMSDFDKRYEKVRKKTPGLDAWVDAGCPPGVAHSMDRDIALFLEAFPGDAAHWAARSLSRFERGDTAEAWLAIQRACKLMPQDTAYRGWELRLVSQCLPASEAEARLSSAYAEIERGEAPAAVCHGFAFAAMELALNAEHRTDLLQQVLTAAREGVHATTQPMQRKVFQAIERIARETLAGRKRDREILFRYGLGKMAAAAPQETDPWEILRRAVGGASPRVAARRGHAHRRSSASGAARALATARSPFSRKGRATLTKELRARQRGPG